MTSSDLELGELADKKDEAKEKEAAEKAKPLVERFKKALGDKVVDVRAATPSRGRLLIPTALSVR